MGAIGPLKHAPCLLLITNQGSGKIDDILLVRGVKVFGETWSSLSGCNGGEGSQASDFIGKG